MTDRTRSSEVAGCFAVLVTRVSSLRDEVKQGGADRPRVEWHLDRILRGLSKLREAMAPLDLVTQRAPDVALTAPGSITPWGAAQDVTHIGDGIHRVSTASHGGYFVQLRHLAAIPEPWRDYAIRWTHSRQWFEEDCAWAIVALCFPDLFNSAALVAAHDTAARWLPCPVCGEPAGDGALRRPANTCSRGHVVTLLPEVSHV